MLENYCQKYTKISPDSQKFACPCPQILMNGDCLITSWQYWARIVRCCSCRAASRAASPCWVRCWCFRSSRVETARSSWACPSRMRPPSRLLAGCPELPSRDFPHPLATRPGSPQWTRCVPLHPLRRHELFRCWSRYVIFRWWGLQSRCVLLRWGRQCWMSCGRDSRVSRVFHRAPPSLPSHIRTRPLRCSLC